MTEVNELNLESLLDLYKKSKLNIEEQEAAKKVIADELLERLKKMKVTGTKVGNTYISRSKRALFSEVSLSQAEELGAVKTEKDTTKLKKLLDDGVKIKGVKFIEYLFVKEKDE